MATSLPITKQIRSSLAFTYSSTLSDVSVSEVKDFLLYNRHGVCVPFKSLYQSHKAIVIFVRVCMSEHSSRHYFHNGGHQEGFGDLRPPNQNFLCYTCQEYVEDLSKIPPEMLLDAGIRLVVIGQSGYSHIAAFCSLTGYQHEIYVDPERQIYKKLGMKRGENYDETASQSPHVKSNMLVGSIKSMWRAMTSPAFDFQGDPLQQGGALIIGPGPNIHVAHFDMNRFNHMPINWLLQLAGMQVVNFNRHPKIIDI